MTVHVGSHSRYSNGCRCEPCRDAHRAYTRERRAKALAEDTLSHGIAGTFDAGCRCRHCVAAKKVYRLTGPGQYVPKFGRRLTRGA